MGNGLATNDGDVIRTNQEADAASHLRGMQGQSSMTDAMEGGGGSRVPGETPAEVPADNRDPGNETPMPGGDDAPMPGGDTVTTPDAPSPTPAPTEVPQVGSGGPPLSSEDIASDVRGNGGLGAAMGLEMSDATSSTEDAMARAANARDAAGK